jgi:spermidine/putrescine transport system permease protein
MATVTAKYRAERRSKGLLLGLPATLWLFIFFILPLGIVLFVSFMTRGQRGTLVMPLTLEHYADVFGAIYFPVIVRSVWIAFLTTMICLVVGYPLGFFISTRASARMRNIALFLVILPFWTNFLVRTYAMQTLLGTEGTINSFLLSWGLIQEPLQLLNTPGAVLAGLVYGFLPFMVLPIYATVERFDFKLVEAAHDLGANDWTAFWRVILPVTLPGVVAGCILVFIPAIGAFITPDLLGGNQGLMIGNLIQGQFGRSNNWPRGAALSIVLMMLVMAALILYIRFGEQED